MPKGAVAEKPKAKASTKKNKDAEAQNKKTKAASPAKGAEAKASKKAEAPKGKKAATSEGYTPKPNSQRDFIMRAMRKGGTPEKIKVAAAVFGAKAKAENLGDPANYRGFDLSFFAKFLKSKGHNIEINEEKGTYKLND